MYRRSLGMQLLSWVMSLVAVASTQAGQVEFFSTDTPDPSSGFYAGTIGFGVSNNGVVAATTNLGSANEKAFTFTTGGSQATFNLPGRVLSISADGSKATGFFTNGGTAGAMTWDTTTQNYVHLNSLFGYTTGAAISRNGQYSVGFGSSQMASWNSDGTGGTPLGNITGPSWVPAANFGWAGAVSDTGLVGGTSGYASIGDGRRVAVIAQAGVANSTQQLGDGVLDGTVSGPNAPYGKVLGISTEGNILIGESYVASGVDAVNHAFIVDRRSSDTLVDMGILSGFTQTRAQNLTDAVFGTGLGESVVVGSAWGGVVGANDYTNITAVIWLPGLGPQALADYALSAWGVSLPTNYRLLTAYGISTDGRYISGSALDASGNQVGYLLTTGLSPSVPEPSSVVTLALGAGLALLTRRKLQRKSA